MSRPRVLLVGRTRYRLPLPPGLARKWDALERELDYRVLASAADHAQVSSQRFELIPPARPRAFDGLLFYLRLPWRIARAIREFRPQALVAEDPYVSAAAMLARRLAGSPRPRLIAEVHGNWLLSTRLYGSPARRILSPLGDALGRRSLRRADAVRAVSAYTAGLVESVRGAPPLAEFPTYSDLGAFAGRPRRPLPEPPAALFVGSLELTKNVDGLVEAWRSVARELPDARLVVVGTGSRRPLVDQLAAELPEQVEYIPELTPEEVAERMDESWALVLPSRSEGLPRIVIESFACGRGVIAGRVGGILDLVRDGVEGLLVDPQDTGELAAALVRVLSDREFAEQLGAAAAERFREWDSTPEEFAARFRALVEAALH